MAKRHNKKKRTHRRSRSSGKLDLKHMVMTAGVGGVTVIAAKYLSKLGIFESLGGGKFTFTAVGAALAFIAFKFIKDPRIKTAVLAGSGVPILLGIAQMMGNQTLIDSLSLSADDDLNYMYPMQRQSPYMLNGAYMLDGLNQSPLGADLQSDPLGA